MKMKKLLFVLALVLLIGAVEATDLEWTELNGSAFPARYNHATTIFDSKIWVIGGYNGTSYLNDSWYSTDGTTWVEANDTCSFEARAGHELLTLGTKMYVIGGYNASVGANNTYPAMWDVWESSDGSNWTLTTNTPAWKGSYLYYGGDPYGIAFAASTVGDGKMWIAGGYQYNDHSNYSQLSNNIWYSTDGGNWTDSGNCPTYDAGWYNSDGWERSEMEWMSLAYIGGKYTTTMTSTSLLPSGGTAYSTLDGGTSWDTRTESGYWTPRYDFGLVYLDSKLILMGGYGTTYLRDVWYSDDEGETWSEYSDGGWTARYGVAVTEWNGKAYLTGGRDPSGAMDDVWEGEFNTSAVAPGEEDTTGGYGLQYPPHNVRFVFVDTTGTPIDGATVTADPGETSLGAWGWITDIFGFNDDVDIAGTTMTGTTGSDGSISFLMIAEINYNVSCVKASDSVNHTVSIFPKESEYFIRIGRLPYVTDYPEYNLTAYELNATHVRLQANFTDDANQTNPITFYVRNDTGTVYSAAFNLTAGNGTMYYDVPNTRGSTYQFGFNGTNTQHGNVSAFQGIDMKGSGPLVDYGWSDFYYQIAALAIIFLVAGGIGAMDVKIGAIIVPVFAGIFWYIGWLPDTIGRIIYIGFFVGVLYYMRASYKAVDS